MNDTPSDLPIPPLKPPPDSAAAAARAHVPSLAGRRSGEVVALSPEQSRHLARVRRLSRGDAVQVFDDGGRTSRGILAADDAAGVRLLADPAAAPVAAGGAGGAGGGEALVVYAAVPKGGRADWMVEKLCELGVGRFVPIVTARGVVEPGDGKLGRFARLAREAAKQSRRAGVMRIGPLTPLADALAGVARAATPAAVLATETPGASLLDLDAAAVFVGPEGGWTPAELAAFAGAGVPAATLANTVLRVETAAVRRWTWW